VKATAKPQSTTSVPRAPDEEAGARFTKYLITMGIRIACFILMVAITPYGWYTWVFGVGATVLPYVAVVLANVGQDTHISRAESPFIAIEAPVAPSDAAGGPPPVIRISEAPPPPEERRQG
jgi:hypothetical protein